MSARERRSQTVPWEAVIFDCDELLLETGRCWTRGYAALFAHYGREYTMEDKRRLMGIGQETCGRILAELFEQPGRAEELSVELLARCWDEVASGASPKPGAVELIGELAGRTQLGLATNSPRKLAEAALQNAGLDGRFDVVVGGDEVAYAKPDPDIYLTTCRRLDASLTRAVALEDSPTGVAAASAAGLRVIGVPSLPGTELGADLVANSLANSSVFAMLFDESLDALQKTRSPLTGHDNLDAGF